MDFEAFTAALCVFTALAILVLSGWAIYNRHNDIEAMRTTCAPYQVVGEDINIGADGRRYVNCLDKDNNVVAKEVK